MPLATNVSFLATAPLVVPGAITVAEAATRLGISPRTVRRWVERGRLSASTSGDGRILLSSDAVEDMRARVTTDPACLLW
ncbi:helix-turn-helix domain-containing protein [Solicola sp. PLA-1-18]|uniref:helix-turn-helix domain-containing protein n=1 Tax=Solicola sp. PLA-1-18 TaxID=3380532 RepID=UPI003B7C95DC